MISIDSGPVSAEEYAALRAAVGFGSISVTTAKTVLEASLFEVSARDSNGELRGIARAVGDGVLYAFITDVFVHPAVQGQGVGDLLVDRLTSAIVDAAHANATIALVAAPGREAFYERFGFERAPNHVFGSGMTHLARIELDDS